MWGFMWTHPNTDSWTSKIRNITSSQTLWLMHHGNPFLLGVNYSFSRLLQTPKLLHEFSRLPADFTGSERQHVLELGTGLLVFGHLLGKGVDFGTRTYFLSGQIHRPQQWAMSVRFFSASLMSLLMESMPSSIRSNCSVRNRSFM